jgi:hypothetical protein
MRPLPRLRDTRPAQDVNSSRYVINRRLAHATKSKVAGAPNAALSS